MNIRFIINAIRFYGVKGIIRFLCRKITKSPLEIFLRDRIKDNVPITGITIIGCLDRGSSLSKVLRDLAYLLHQAGIPFQVLNIPCEKPISLCELEHLLTPREKFITNKYSDIVTMRVPLHIADKRCRVHVIEFWEFEEGLQEARPEIFKADNILAMSDFNRDLLMRVATKANIRKILYPFQFHHRELAPRSEIREKFNIPQTAFAVFFNFDFQSSYYRKNPEGILTSFQKAFSPNDNAVIVFKTMRAAKHPILAKRLRTLACDLHITHQLIMIDDFIPQEDLVNLTNACDVYMSLHRGEGFGLGIAEAMTLSKPVIVTDYSASKEFCNAENSMPIPYKMVDVRPDQHDISDYRYVKHWAEPDADAAAQALRKLYDDPPLRIAIGRRGQASIEAHFSLDHFRKSVEEFLHPDL